MAHTAAVHDSPDAHASHDAHATNTGISNFKLGFWTFLASECLFFGTLISTYMVYKGSAIVGPYPADLFDILHTTLSTTILLFSSLAMVLALHYVHEAKRNVAIGWLFAVIAMGGAFLYLEFQSYLKYIGYGLTIGSSTFGSSYYVLTGTHKAHVAVGMIWMAILAWRIHQGKIPPSKSDQVEVAGLYWHFVDIIWIVIFTLVYLIP
jgi:heme/copper-type cytochrome/quinol oxidase subunit 3